MSGIEEDEELSPETIRNFLTVSFQKDSPLGRAIMARIVMGIATPLEGSLFTKEEIAMARLLSELQLLQEKDDRDLLGC